MNTFFSGKELACKYTDLYYLPYNRSILMNGRWWGEIFLKPSLCTKQDLYNIIAH